MRVIVDLEKKSLKVIENERPIFKGEVGADKITLLINKVLTNEYPTITALLSNGRKIGPYTTDDSYGNEKIDDVTYTTADFTLSKANGFTLSEGKMQVTIWMESDGKKEAIGNLLLNVVNTTTFDDENIIVSGDVAGAVVNMRTAIDNAVAQVNLNGVKVNKLDAEKASVNYVAGISSNLKAYVDENINTKTDKTTTAVLDNKVAVNISEIAILKQNKADKTYVDNELNTKADISYVNEKFDTILGEGASESLDTISEISKALEEHADEYDALLQTIGNKVDKSQYEAHINNYNSVVNSVNNLEQSLNLLNQNKADKTELFSKNYNDLTNKPQIPTKLSDLEIDMEIGGSGGGSVSEEDVLEIIEQNSEQVDVMSIGTSDAYDSTSDEQIPTSKAVATMINSSKIYKHTYYLQWYDNEGYLTIMTIYRDISTSAALKTKQELLNSWLIQLRAKAFNSNQIEMYRLDNKQFVAIVNDYYNSDSLKVDDANRSSQTGPSVVANEFINRFEILDYSLVEEV